MVQRWCFKPICAHRLHHTSCIIHRAFLADLNGFTCSMNHQPEYLMSTVEKKTVSLYSITMYIKCADATRKQQYRACVM